MNHLTGEIDNVFIELEALTDNLMFVSDGIRYSSDDKSAANAVMIIVSRLKDLCEKLKTITEQKSSRA